MFLTPSESLQSEIPTNSGPSMPGSSSGSATGGAKKWVPKKRSKKSQDPLNRGSRSSTTATEGRSPSVAGVKRKKFDVDWPPQIALGDDARKPSLVKCDQCDAWYHTVCVGIDEKTQNIDSVVFVCPRCVAKWTYSAPRRTYGRRDGHSSSICSRPDCKVPTMKSGLQSEEEFVVEAIIGRRKCPDAFPQVTWQYLLKWEGYCVDESTWTHESDIAGTDVLVPQFEKAAAEEGLSPSTSDTILLRISKEESSKDWLLVP